LDKDKTRSALNELLTFSSLCFLVYLSSFLNKRCILKISIREHSFLGRRGGGLEEFRGGSLIFCLPKKGGSA